MRLLLLSLLLAFCHSTTVKTVNSETTEVISIYSISDGDTTDNPR